MSFVHFIKLFCAVTLCYTDKYIRRERTVNFIRESFDEYIEEFINIYGIEYISSNVYNLTHVVVDVLKFGNLSKISAYQFENCLYSLKLRLRKCDNPLEQISRRIVELDLDYREAINEMSVCPPILSNPFKYQQETVFGSIVLNGNFVLNNKKNGDKWFLIDSKIVEFHFATKHNDEYLIYGYCVEKLNNFFTRPISSTIINIYSGKIKKSNQIAHFNLNNIMAKMICMQKVKDSEEFVFMPLLHTIK